VTFIAFSSIPKELQHSGQGNGFFCSVFRSTAACLRLREWTGRRCQAWWQHLGNGVDEAVRHCKGCGYFRSGKRRGRGTDAIIGALLELISGAKKFNEVAPDAGFSSGQPI
jgi:hypothetical protein